MKKITAIISTNRKVIARKVVVLSGVVLGIGIGLLLNKVDDDDMVIYNEEHSSDRLNDEADNVRWGAAEPQALEGEVSE
jgi:hypothetical protein